MAMRSAVALSAIPKGMLHRLFCSSSSTTTSSFLSQATAAASQAPGRVQNEPSSNLFVSGLSKRTTSDGLRKAFSQFGEVLSARVVTDRESNYSKGYGFVRYATIEEAQKGIEGMDGKFLDGWVIFAEYARPRSTPAAQQNNMGPGYGSNNFSSYA